MVEIHGELPKWVPTKSTNVSAYHDKQDCLRLHSSTEVFKRDREYIAWHELDPCPWCHDGMTPEDKHDKGECGTLAKTLKYGDDEERREVLADG